MAYQGHEGVKGYDPSAVKNMQKTQFRLDDGHNFYNDYGTTMKVSYVPKETTRTYQKLFFNTIHFTLSQVNV